MASQDMLDLEGLLSGAVATPTARPGDEGDLSAMLEDVAASTESVGERGAGPSLSQQPIIDMSKHPSGIIPTLQNIVATVNLECRLDLKTIALHARNAEYNPKVN